MMTRRWIWLIARGLLIRAAAAVVLIVTPTPASAHEFALESLMNAFVKIEPREAHLAVRVPLHVLKSPGFPTNGREIDVANADAAVQRALAQLGSGIRIWEDGRPLVASSAVGRLELPSDRSFSHYRDAVARIAAPVAPGTAIYVDQGYLDAHFTYPIRSPKSRFSVQTTVAPELKDYLKLAIRYVPADEAERAMLITSRSGRVALNPAWYQAATGFVALGLAHILSGVDHLLFLLCLVIPVRRLRDAIGIVTAFTLAHSVTLLGSAFNLPPEGTWFPPLVEALIAASIVYMALENIVGADVRHRWLIAGLFGLVHGFGFSYGLRENLQFAGQHLLVSLFSFNLGIEIGQLLVLALMLPVLAVLLRSVLAGRMGMIVLSAVVAHVGWHWMTERVDVLWRVPWPRPDASDVMVVARWVAALLLAVGAASLIVRRARVAARSALSPIGQPRAEAGSAGSMEGER